MFYQIMIQQVIHLFSGMFSGKGKPKKEPSEGKQNENGKAFSV